MREQVVIVTGASSGIGRETALAAARQGYRVVLTARREEQLEELARSIEAFGREALAVPGDITRAADQQRVIDQTIERFGRIDVLVNNAGVPIKEGFVDAPLEQLQQQWQVNVASVIELSKRALPHLIGTRGTIINVGSIAGHFSVPGWGLYYPTKVAVASINDTLRRELKPYGVKVCLVEPGPIATEFANKAGTPDLDQMAFPPQIVANIIVRLIERPKRLVMAPVWLKPLVYLGGGLARLLPGVVDLIVTLGAKRQERAVDRSVAT